MYLYLLHIERRISETQSNLGDAKSQDLPDSTSSSCAYRQVTAMNNFLKNLFSTSKTPQKFASSSLNHSRADLASVQNGSENATRQQLIQTLHRDLMRKHGIPLEWTACHTQVMVSRTKGTGMAVVLVVKHWDERMMNHTFALQRALASDIIAFEPAAEQWLQGITWRLEVASTCPHISLPEKSFWNNQYASAPTAQAMAEKKAELAAVKAELAANHSAANANRGQLANMQADLAIRTSQLAERSLELAEVKRELAMARANRPAAAAPLVAPTFAPQRTEFMPHKAAVSFAPSAAAALEVEAPDDSQAMQDLDRLFAIRDTALGQPAATGSSGGIPATPLAGYEATQPSPLRA